MSKLSKTLNTLMKLGVFAGAAMYGMNKYIDSTSTANNILDNETGEYFDWSHGRVFYNKIGSGSPILLLHDIDPVASGFEWNDVAQILANKYTVYIVDLPGCGRSSKLSNDNYINYLYVRFLKEFIDHVIGDKTDIVASGLSGSCVVMAASIHEHIINDIVLVNPISPKKLSSFVSVSTKFVKGLLDCPILGTFLYHMINSHKNIEDNLAKKLYDPTTVISSDLIYSYYESAHLAHANGKYLLSSLYGQYMGVELERAFHSLTNNITLIFGKEVPGSLSISDEYSLLNSKVKSIYIAKAKMLPQLESPVKLANYIMK